MTEHMITLDQALAMVAAAYERAAQECDRSNLGLDPADVADDIRALTPIDTKAVLYAMLKAERENALKEAAEIPAIKFGLFATINSNDEYFFQKGFEAYRAALIEQENAQ